MKKKLYEVFKDQDNIWKVQFPRGIMPTSSKKEAQKLSREMMGHDKILEVR